MKRKERLAIAREFSRLVKFYDPRPRLTFLYSDGTGDILPEDEKSARWKAEANIHCWLDAKPFVTFLSRRGTSDIMPFKTWKAHARVLAARKRRRSRAA